MMIHKSILMYLLAKKVYETKELTISQLGKMVEARGFEPRSILDHQ